MDDNGDNSPHADAGRGGLRGAAQASTRKGRSKKQIKVDIIDPLPATDDRSSRDGKRCKKTLPQAGKPPDECDAHRILFIVRWSAGGQRLEAGALPSMRLALRRIDPPPRPHRMKRQKAVRSGKPRDPTHNQSRRQSPASEAVRALDRAVFMGHTFWCCAKASMP